MLQSMGRKDLDMTERLNNMGKRRERVGLPGAAVHGSSWSIFAGHRPSARAGRTSCHSLPCGPGAEH